MIPGFPVYLFDVDGTLLDSAPDICGALHEALRTAQADGVPDALLRRYIGRHLSDLFRDLFPLWPAERIEAIIQDYRTAYRARGHAGTKLFPGVAEALSRLSGRKATATTKSTASTVQVLEQFGLLGYFDHVQGTDGFPSKPAPEVIYRALDALKARPEECLFVGDSAADMEAGRRAGVSVCAVLYGYGDPQELARWAPDYWISDLRQLADFAAEPAALSTPARTSLDSI
ncbi:MAG: HAD family hydrolase [Bryobacterales bacterium]|nr:HAD family hydrolase [Bryobacteraceae bacterium]MDW8354276.1 HAD family hydrolase [Bryobacterales bacterium]